MRFYAFLYLALLGCSPAVLFAQQTELKLKIGSIAPLSGPAQAYGEAARNGIQMALDDIDNPSIRVLYEDDQFLPSRTVSAFNKLAKIDRVDLIVNVGSATL